MSIRLTCWGENSQNLLGGCNSREAVASSDGDRLLAYRKTDLPVTVGSPAVKGPVHESAGGVFAGGTAIYYALSLARKGGYIRGT